MAVLRRGVLYVRREHEFRMIERIHRVRLVTACVSRRNLFEPHTGRPLRELAVFSSALCLSSHRIVSRAFVTQREPDLTHGISCA